jgi:hypothetical protein
MTYVVPEQRELPEWLKKGQQSTQAVADLLRRQKAALAAVRRETEEARKQTAELTEAFGLALYRKRDAPNASEFRTLFDALQTSGVELITYVGEPFVGDLEELADVVDWIDSAEGIPPGSIAEAFEPEIRLGGRLIHRAKLICVLEQPAADEPQNARSDASIDNDGQNADPSAQPSTEPVKAE